MYMVGVQFGPVLQKVVALVGWHLTVFNACNIKTWEGLGTRLLWLYMHPTHPKLLNFHVITGSGALCFGDLIIPANSLTASSVWVFGPGCFAVLVGG